MFRLKAGRHRIDPRTKEHLLLEIPGISVKDLLFMID